MPDQSPRLSLPYLMPSQAQKHVTHNAALEMLDALVQLSVLSRDLTTPPADPAEGDRHIVAASGQGTWNGQDGAIASFQNGAWLLLPPRTGWCAYVASEGQALWWDGATWGPARLDNLPGLGVNAASDATNRLAVAAPASLFSHEGAGHRMKVNKSAETDTAGLLFQTGWSGRAEIGLAGSDDFSLKVSPDGGSWISALTVDRTDGTLSGAAVQASATDTASGRLLTVGAFGLGATTALPEPASNDLDDAVTTGWYDIDSGTLNSPLGGQSGLCRVEVRTPQRRVQTACRVSGGSKPQVYTRISYGDGSSFSDWREVYNAATILGTVSQSGGIPTGAVIERGSNANGEYIRWADGTQFCTNGNAAITTAPATFSGTITKIDGDKLWIGSWF